MTPYPILIQFSAPGVDPANYFKTKNPAKRKTPQNDWFYGVSLAEGTGLEPATPCEATQFQ